jgi:hypothetical protein
MAINKSLSLELTPFDSGRQRKDTFHNPIFDIDKITTFDIFNSTILINFLFPGVDGERPLEFPVEVLFSFGHFVSFYIFSCSPLFREHLKKQIQTEEGKIMGKKRRLSIKWGIMLVIVGLVVIQTEAFPGEPGLEFPFAPSEVINELRSFGVPGWGTAEEDHFGIDLIPSYKPFPFNFKLLHKVKVVAPTEGTIRAIWVFDSGDQGVAANKDICVILEMNRYWSIILMFEPKTSDFLRGAVEGRYARSPLRLDST